MFRFNPAFGFFQELESLLKKVYSSLSVHEKKRYFVPKAIKMPIPVHAMLPPKKAKEKLLVDFWARLQTIKHVFFSAKSQTSQSGSGKGDVTANLDTPNSIVFKEIGQWKTDHGHAFDFTNSYRWTYNEKAQAVSLEHLRHGSDYPVFLFDLVPTGPSALESLHSHLCKEDTYFGQIICQPHFVQLSWRVIGPKKNDEITCLYT